MAAFIVSVDIVQYILLAILLFVGMNDAAFTATSKHFARSTCSMFNRFDRVHIPVEVGESSQKESALS